MFLLLSFAAILIPDAASGLSSRRVHWLFLLLSFAEILIPDAASGLSSHMVHWLFLLLSCAAILLVVFSILSVKTFSLCHVFFMRYLSRSSSSSSQHGLFCLDNPNDPETQNDITDEPHFLLSSLFDG